MNLSSLRCHFIVLWVLATLSASSLGGCTRCTKAKKRVVHSPQAEIESVAEPAPEPELPSSSAETVQDRRNSETTIEKSEKTEGTHRVQPAIQTSGSMGDTKHPIDGGKGAFSKTKPPVESPDDEDEEEDGAEEDQDSGPDDDESHEISEQPSAPRR